MATTDTVVVYLTIRDLEILERSLSTKEPLRERLRRIRQLRARKRESAAQLIIDWINTTGPEGFTASEAQAATGFGHNTTATLLSNLRVAGVIIARGDKRASVFSRLGTVYVSGKVFLQGQCNEIQGTQNQSGAGQTNASEDRTKSARATRHRK